jgi:formylmethanofuran dehydrogenase subunit E
VCLLGKVSERLPDSGKVAFALVEMKSLGGCGVCVGDTAGRSEDVSEVEQGVGVLA